MIDAAERPSGDAAASAREDPSPCRSCGACCDHSAEWPRFTTESDAELARIPGRFAALNGMRCLGSRCSALAGEVGKATTCQVYEVRPEVCRVCEPGDEACTMARLARGLTAIDQPAGLLRPIEPHGPVSAPGA